MQSYPNPLHLEKTAGASVITRHNARPVHANRGLWGGYGRDISAVTDDRRQRARRGARVRGGAARLHTLGALGGQARHGSLRAEETHLRENKE